MRIVFGTDTESPVCASVIESLTAGGHEVAVVAVGSEWPEVGRAVGEAVAGGAADLGVACCWTGTGVSIAANKVPGVRAALCVDGETATGARRWNDANVLAMGLRLTSVPVAAEIVDAFLAGRPDDGERAAIGRVE